MSFSKEEYWKQRQEINEFRELFWAWRAECKRRYGWTFIKRNMHLFTQSAFREYLDMYESIEEARQYMVDGVDEPTNTLTDIDPEVNLDKFNIGTTVEQSPE